MHKYFLEYLSEVNQPKNIKKKSIRSHKLSSVLELENNSEFREFKPVQIDE